MLERATHLQGDSAILSLWERQTDRRSWMGDNFCNAENTRAIYMWENRTHQYPYTASSPLITKGLWLNAGCTLYTISLHSIGDTPAQKTKETAHSIVSIVSLANTSVNKQMRPVIHSDKHGLFIYLTLSIMYQTQNKST